MRSIDELIPNFETYLKSEIMQIANRSPIGLYQPVADALTFGGKRIRPALLLHSASLFSDNTDPFLPAAMAIEIFHNFTLLHDDIMDNADIRRGKPAIHKLYGQNSAILSGDAMSIMAYQYLAGCRSTHFNELVALFSKPAVEVCEGQQHDMEFETRNDVTIDEYIEMIRLKTAVLKAASLKIGAILANAKPSEAQLLYDFGIYTGLAFQLQDDWLDTFGDEATFGKKIGGDILENKKTYLMLKARALSSKSSSAELDRWLSASLYDPDEKIAAVTAIFSESGAGEATRQQMNHYHDKAVETLSKLEICTENKAGLTAFAGKVLSRKA